MVKRYNFSITIILLLILGNSLVTSSEQHSHTNNPIISLEDGKIQGQKNITVGKKQVYYSFKGIPYAEPPVGDLRFRSPKRKSKWEGVLDGTKYRSACVQSIIGGSTIGSEDCLHINVYTPNIRANLPVIAYIHGGFFIAGNSSNTLFGPDYLVEQDVVFVTFNYRLGVFGFLSTEDLVIPGNWALKDQILALKWIKNNIDKFGGNPKKITIFGESSGSACVSYLLQSKKTTGLFQQAIMISGNSLNPWSLSRRASDAAFGIGRKLGLGWRINSTQLLTGLRKVKVNELLETAGQTMREMLLLNPMGGLIFAPVSEPEHEESVYSGKSFQLLSDGDFQRIPCMIGYNSDEGNVFEPLRHILKFYLIATGPDQTKFLPANFGTGPFTGIYVGSKIKEHFFGNVLIFGLQDKNIYRFITFDQFVRGLIEGTRLQSQYSDTYLFRFSYSGKLDQKQDRQAPGASHGAVLNYVFPRVKNESSIPDADKVMRSKVVKLLTNFAKFGNPTPESDKLLSNAVWKAAGKDSNNLNYLDINSTISGKVNPEKHDMDFYDGIYEKYGGRNYDTY